jgi:hypothetical protein
MCHFILNFENVKIAAMFYQFCCLITKVTEGLLHSYHQFCAVVVGLKILRFLFQYFGDIPEVFLGVNLHYGCCCYLNFRIKLDSNNIKKQLRIFNYVSRPPTLFCRKMYNAHINF